MTFEDAAIAIAAAAAGLRCCQLVRNGDSTRPSSRHRDAADFPDVARRFAPPAAPG